MTDQPKIGRAGVDSLRRGLARLGLLLLAAIAGAAAAGLLAIARCAGSRGVRKTAGPANGRLAHQF